MKKCKKHIYCRFKGKGKHNGCQWHGIVDGCTNEPPFQSMSTTEYDIRMFANAFADRIIGWLESKIRKTD